MADYYRRQGVTDPRRFPDSAEPSEPPKKVKVPNKTEALCMVVLGYCAEDFTYEGKTFDVCGGGRYTPDWVSEDRQIAIEVKGEHIHSRDSRRRFDEARMIYPGWRWIWARKRTKGRKGMRWDVEVYG